MIRNMPYADWQEAQESVDVIRQRLRMADLPDIERLLEAANRSLVRDRSPALAGIQLEYIAEQLRIYPHLRLHVSNLSELLMQYTTIEPRLGG